MFMVNTDGRFTRIQTTIYCIFMITESMQELRRQNHLQGKQQKEKGGYVAHAKHKAKVRN